MDEKGLLRQEDCRQLYFCMGDTGKTRAAPAILFACLVFTLTAPLYIWTILGM